MNNEVKIVVTSEDKTDFSSAKRNAERSGTEAGKKFSDAVGKGSKSAGEKLSTSLQRSTSEIEREGERAGRRFSSAFRRNIKEGSATLKELGKSIEQLDSKIEEHRQTVRALGNEYARTGDKDVFKKLRESRSAISSLQSVRDELRGFAGEAESSGLQIGDKLKGALSALSGKLMLIGAVVGASFIGAVNAAIIAGATIGGIGLGALLLKDQPQVLRAALGMANSVVDVMKNAATPMVKPFVAALGRIQEKITSLSPAFKGMFSSAAPQVSKIVDALFGLIDGVLPALNQALANSGPIFDALAEAGKSLGRDVGWALTIMTGDAQKSSNSLLALADAAGRLIVAVALLARGLQYVFDPFMRALLTTRDKVKGFFETLSELPGKAGDMASNVVKGMEALEGVSGSLETTGASASGAARETDKLASAMAALSSQLLAMSGTEIAWQAALDNATEAVKKNGNTARRHGAILDTNTEKGRANKQAIDAIAAATEQHVAKMKEAGAAQSKVNAVLGRAYTRFVSTAHAAGMTKTAADKLARSYGLLPAAKHTKITAPGARAAKSVIDSVRASINRLRSRTVQLTVKQVYKTYGAASALAFQKYKASGYARGGPLSGAQSGGPRNDLVVVGEQGEETFDPRSQTIYPSANRRIMDMAKSSRGGSSPAVIELRSSGRAIDDLLLRVLRDAITVRGGDVQVVLGRR